MLAPPTSTGARTFGAPTVFASRFVQTHVRVYKKDDAIELELWEHPRLASTTLRVAERLAIAGRVPDETCNLILRCVGAPIPQVLTNLRSRDRTLNDRGGEALNWAVPDATRSGHP
jgi:hypothetical protein